MRDIIALVPAVPVPSAMRDFGKGGDNVTAICGQVMCPGEVSTSRWVTGCDGVWLFCRRAPGTRGLRLRLVSVLGALRCLVFSSFYFKFLCRVSDSTDCASAFLQMGSIWDFKHGSRTKEQVKGQRASGVIWVLFN